MFLSMTEAPLPIRPLLSNCTESELHSIMTAGFASVAGAVLAAYISFGASATDLLAATIMSTPGALAISKLVFPETKKISMRQSLFEFEIAESDDPNMIQIGGQLIAIIALIDMLNGWLKGIGTLIDIALSLQIITSYIFFPFAWLMGVPIEDCLKVASLIGTKIMVNEFAAFAKLALMVDNNTISHKAITIATYALCGFSNISSMGVSVGVLSSLVPEKREVLNKLVTSAMFAGNAACFMTACIAGLFYRFTRLKRFWRICRI
jgi:CNT family concentrative nucleoside transporter